MLQGVGRIDEVEVMRTKAFYSLHTHGLEGQIRLLKTILAELNGLLADVNALYMSRA
jgi:hypothetical protein